ncbi:RnfH family protein [Methylotetracoccus oryzae]|uniref:RnfH family protein n=1 Tax=Methylotetracoccus oryzae TaxID=1919059 RepID=UPI00111BA4B2|nr:RnfH family protein [Methylotetracoccus oryzae]
MTGATRVEVCYATPERQFLIPVEVVAGSTIEQAIRQSGLLERCPEISLSDNKVGIFGKLAELAHVVQSGDRIEIYRPLRAAPQDLRRKRARAQRQR